MVSLVCPQPCNNPICVLIQLEICIYELCFSTPRLTSSVLAFSVGNTHSKLYKQSSQARLAFITLHSHRPGHLLLSKVFCLKKVNNSSCLHALHFSKKENT